jgi:hypothetical protein
MQAHGGMTRAATRLAGLVVGAAVMMGCGSNDGKLRVNGLEPRSGDAMGGQIVQINGQNFMKTTRTVKVYFGDQIGNFIRFKSDTEMVVEAPGGKPDATVDVLVVFQPGGEITIPKAFTFKEKKGMDADDLQKK